MARWLWNDHLDPDRLAAQMDQMLDMGLGGALIRPGAGLPPETYLSEAWFEAINAVARRTRKRRASLWIAEDLEDSHTQDVIADILRQSPRHAAQLLAMNDLAPGTIADPSSPTDEIIATFAVTRESSRSGGPEPRELRWIPAGAADPEQSSRRLVFRVTALPDRLRLFEPKATLELLDRTHQLYHAHSRKYFGNTIGLCLLLGADLPHAPGMAPWDSELPALFHETYGYALAQSLPALFFDLPGCETVRADFWGLTDEMLREGFDEPFARWCTERGVPHACAMPQAGAVKHTVARGGRAMARHAAHSFAALSAPPREYGASEDWVACIEARSVKRQLSLEGVVEIAAAGTPAMGRIARGVNFLAARTVQSSLRGDRKECAQALFIPLDDHAHARATTDAEARLAWMLGQGQAAAPLLLLHPHASLQASYCARAEVHLASPVHDAIARHFESITCALVEAHIEFDYGDEALLSKHGTADHRALRVGAAEYRAVLLPPLLNVRSSTLELLHDFAIGGGLVIAAGSLAELVDGRRSDRVLRFFEDYGEHVVQGVDFGRYGALVECLRRASLDTRLTAPDSASGPDRLVIQRRVWDEIEMVALHNAGEALAHVALAYPARVTGRAESWDPLTGDTRVLGPANAGGSLEQPIALGPGTAALVVTTPQTAEAAPPRAEVEESRMTPAWSVRRVEPNIAVLRECRIAQPDAAAEWTNPDSVRRVLAERLTHARGPVSLRTQWRFRVGPGPAVISGCAVAAELSEGASLALNGAELPVESAGWRLDPAFRLLELPPLSAGEHQIEVWQLYSAAGDFQPLWVQGPFDNLAHEGDPPRLAPAHDTTTPGELSAHGLAAYFGAIVYAARVDGFAPGDARRIELRMRGTRRAAEVRVDGSRVGFVLPPQDVCDLTGAWRSGPRLVEIAIMIPPDGLLAALRGQRPADVGPFGTLAAPDIAVFARRGGTPG